MATDRRLYRIAVIAGDGIGPEILPEGVRVLEAVAKRHSLTFAFDWVEYGNCDYYLRHGQMMPDDWKDRVAPQDAIFFGSVGVPDRVPDAISGAQTILRFRREFDQYVNLRPVRLFAGVPTPLAGRAPGDLDIVVVRENTEGEYSPVGGRVFAGTDREMAIQETIMTRAGVERIARYAFECARRRPRRKLTSATKSNALPFSMSLWDEGIDRIAKNFPDVMLDRKLIDALVARIVLAPQDFDVIVASNLFGDILSDLIGGCAGTLGLAPSGNINPERKFPSMFEPVHGSAPDIAGQGIANPAAQILAGAMMLDHLGEAAAARAVEAAVARALVEPTLRTRDLGGRATTVEMGKAIADFVE